MTAQTARIDELPMVEAEAIAGARHGDPFKILGPRDTSAGRVIRAFLPGAQAVEVLRRSDRAVIGQLSPKELSGLFVGTVDDRAPYLLRITWPNAIQETEDPYSFGPLLGDLDLHLFNEGRHFELASAFGANAMTFEGVPGVGFSVWAPNAGRVAVVGDFNSWDSRRHPMRLRYPSGVWELFVPRVAPGTRYKFDIVGAGGVRMPQKADPLAQQTEAPPNTASIVASPRRWQWRDQAWMKGRARRHAPDAPIAIYEVHLPSWMRPNSGLSWDGVAERLIPYVLDMGFTHVELLPITEHPFGGSWGYQPLGLFAPTGRFGAPEGFARFVDRLHASGVGIILDWVPAHFPTDPHGLARFDGTALYEYLDPREGFHRDWNTYIYNFGRREVQGFLIASALHWLERFHIDGLRVDAVASMLYRDYSRSEGEWIPNIYGGREHLEAIGFLRHLNAVVAERCPGVVVIAEESTAWPGVTQPVSEQGLGFAYKWNMGWMHDTLRYIAPTTTTISPSACSMPSLSGSSCRCHTMKSCTARGRCYPRCRGISGRDSPTCALISASCGPIPERSFCSWGARSPKSGNGTTTARSTGSCWPTPPMPVSSDWYAISIASTGPSRRSISATASRLGFAGSSATTARTRCSASRASAARMILPCSSSAT
jgi:1,4-alpha-glucan branching enzyme